MRDFIVNWINKGSGLGQKVVYRPKAGPSQSPTGQSRYNIVPGGNCFVVRGRPSYDTGTNTYTLGVTQDVVARSTYGTSNGLTFDQLAKLSANSPVPVVEVGGNGVQGWFIGDGKPGFGFLSGVKCNPINLNATGFALATPDGGLVPIPPGVYTPGMSWDQLVTKEVIDTVPNAANFVGPNPTQPTPTPSCSPGYQLPPPGGHITCTPGYGWVADAAGCEACAPLCAPSWFPQDQTPTCPAGETLVGDPRTRCVKCLPGSNCFKPGQNPVPCNPPFALEVRGEYQCCVVPTQPATTPTPSTDTYTSFSTATVLPASTSTPLSTGAKVAIGAGAILLLGMLFTRKRSA